MIADIVAFALALVSGLLLLASFVALYTVALPMKEWTWIRQGNTAASVVLGGAVIGFTLPLAEAIRQTNTWPHMIVWSAIALLVQFAGFAALRLWRRDAVAAIERGDMAEAVLLSSASISLGIVNAACLS
jgi:putative membrane protein